MPRRDTIHAVVTKDDGTYVVECHEVAVVTQGRTLDEALANLSEALILHLEDEDLETVGLGGLRRIHVSYDLPVNVTAA
jgi:predicted RNase H-like HicB family nuclease